MFCTGRFYVDGKDYPMIRCDLHLSAKPTGKSGMVLGEGPAPRIHILLESTSGTHLLRWINDQQIKDHTQLRFVNHHRIGADKVFDMYDVRCIENYEDFWGESNKPMTNSITLIPGILIYNGDGPIIQPWHIQNPKNLNRSGVTATERVITTVSETNLVESYYTDTNDNKLEQLREDEVHFHLVTENCIGETIDINFNDSKFNFIYQGRELPNDILSAYPISKGHEVIPLTVIREN